MPISDVVKALPKETINLALLFPSIGVERKPTAISLDAGRKLNDQHAPDKTGEQLPTDFGVEAFTLTMRFQRLNARRSELNRAASVRELHVGT